MNTIYILPICLQKILQIGGHVWVFLAVDVIYYGWTSAEDAWSLRKAQLR